MARVKVNLYASLRRYVDGKPSIDVDVESGETVGQMLEKLGVPTDQTRILFVDHLTAELTSTLKGGETVGVFPSIGGG